MELTECEFTKNLSNLSYIVLSVKSCLISYCCPVSWRPYSFRSAGLALDVLEQFMDGADVGVSNLKTLDLGLSGN